MKRLLSINNYNYRRGGAEVVFLEQNRLLQEAGWDVAVFAMQHENNEASPWSKYFVEEIEFGQPYTPSEKLGKFPKTIYSFEAQKKISALIDAFSPDLAHGHNIYHHISPSILPVLRSRGVPTVLTLHDLKIACPAYKMLTHDGVCERCKGGNLFNVIRHRCVKDSLAVSALVFAEAAVNRLLSSYRDNVTKFVVPSQFYRDKFVEWGWPQDRFTYIPNFVDVERLKPHSHKENYFVFFGRLGPEKGLLTLIDAAAMAGISLVIVGTGPEEHRVRQRVAESGANVAIVGYKSGAELHDIVSRARATVLPSEWYENAPMSVMESYALGTPVIGAAIGGIPELVREGETGHLFESGSARALAQALSGIRCAPDASVSEMGRSGREWVERAFTAERYRENLLALYKDLGVQ